MIYRLCVLPLLLICILSLGDSTVFGQQKTNDDKDTFIVVDGKRDGKWIFWYFNGQKKAEGRYHLGFRIGEWIFYHQNGKIRSKGNYFWDASLNQNHQSIIEKVEPMKENGINDFNDLDTIGMHLLDEFETESNPEESHFDGNKMMVDAGVFESILDQWILSGRWKYYNCKGELISMKVFRNGLLIESIPASRLIDP